MEAFLSTPVVRSGFVTGSHAVVRSRPWRAGGVRMSVDVSQVSRLADEVVRVHDQLVASTILLADAAAPAADVVTEVEQKRGLWGSFVKLIETSIQGIQGGLAGLHVPYSYGFSIIAFTMLVKVLTLPLNVKQMESTMKMQEMQPKVKSIQSQYKDNPQVMNQMLANLYKEENVNPLAGCLPVLAQTPIWIALYRAVLNMSTENLLDESFLWVPSLQGPVAQGGSVKDWLFPLVDGAPPVGWHDAVCYLILPVVLVATQAYSQKVLQPQTDDPQTQQANQILKFLPLLLGWFSLSVPSGLGLYWVTNNVLSTAQTVVLRRRFKANQPEAPASAATLDVEAKPSEAPSLGTADGFSGSTKSPKKKSSKKRKK